MYFTHSLAGAISTKVVLDDKEDIFSRVEKDILWFVGITASVFPDFDLIFYFLNGGASSHREWISHSVVLYGVASTILLAFGFFSKKKERFGRQFYMSLALVFIFGIVTHLVLDYFAGGIALFLPFNTHVYGYDVACKEGGNWIIDYITSAYMLAEAAILLGFLLIFKSIKNKIGRVLPLFYVGVSVLAAGLIGIFIA